MLSRWTLVLCLVVLECLWLLGECRVGDGRAAGRDSRTRRPQPTGAVGVRGYRRFHGNHSLVGRPVPCTPDEKLCLRHNLVFHPPSAKCFALVGLPLQPCDLAIDRAELESGSGHVVGTCLSNRQGDCLGYRMAFDGQCYRQSVVRDVICGCRDPLQLHPLGGMECRCSPLQPAPRVNQPEENGRCVVPDLRSPYVDGETVFAAARSADDILLRCSDAHCRVAPATPRSRCSAAQRRCFRKGEVWVAARNRCFRLLKRGPCENDYLLALSKNESLGHVAFCRHIRGDCPPGKIHMAFDHRCHDEREMRMIAPVDLKRDAFGDYILPTAVDVIYIPTVHGNDCAIRINIIPLYMGRTLGFSKPPCGANNRGNCIVEVYADPPMPLDDF